MFQDPINRFELRVDPELANKLAEPSDVGTLYKSNVQKKCCEQMMISRVISRLLNFLESMHKEAMKLGNWINFEFDQPAELKGIVRARVIETSLPGNVETSSSQKGCNQASRLGVLVHLHLTPTIRVLQHPDSE
jgi:hypothetical protein